MEILHRGTPPSERTHEATCTTCQTKIRFRQGEAKYNADQRDGDYLSITCPVCSRTITKSLFPSCGSQYSSQWGSLDR